MTTSAATLPLRELILAALAGMAANLRAETRFCRDCTTLGRLCPDHREAAAEADDYENAYMQVAAGSPQWCDLTVTLAAGLN